MGVLMLLLTKSELLRSLPTNNRMHSTKEQCLCYNQLSFELSAKKTEMISMTESMSA